MQSESNVLRICLILFSIGRAYCACGSQQFECDNGSCISRFSACDGVKNCPDGSDETGLLCVAQREFCTDPYFLCSYGACVIGTAACDTVKQCADGSDETPLRCGTDDDREEFMRRLQDKCQDGEIKCPSGICIDMTRFMCDGQDDCGDGFDESVSLCGHVDCPGYAFKCASGGCISSLLKCDGKRDCFDGTDESPALCNTTALPAQTTIAPTLIGQYGCPLPRGDELPILQDRHGAILRPPITRETVYFSCHKGFALVGDKSSHCANGQWSLPIVPKCVKFCDSWRDAEGRSKNMLHGYSTNAVCTYEGQSADCSQRYHPPGTEVIFHCATGFNRNGAALPPMKCRPDGYWSRERLPCTQECGQIATPTTQFSANGYSVNNTVVPWHVGIYAWHTEKDYNFLCGGSLLTPDLVITAAHCVYSEATESSYSAETFRVLGAKIYRGYNDRTNEEVSRQVESIIVASGYKGRERNFAKDLALIVLSEPFKLSTLIRPVCVNFYENADKDIVNNDVQGQFAGWNYKDKHELQFVPAKSQMNSVCLANLPDIGSDKFCMYTQGRSLACHGDSGGGFTAKRETTAFARDRERHILYGVISSAPNAGQCAQSLTTLTNIQHFEKMITDAITESTTGRS